MVRAYLGYTNRSLEGSHLTQGEPGYAGLTRDERNLDRSAARGVRTQVKKYRLSCLRGLDNHRSGPLFSPATQGALESIRTPTPAGWRAKVAPQDFCLVVKALDRRLKAEIETCPWRDVHFLGCGLLKRVFLPGLAVEMTGEFCPFDVSLLPGAFSGVDLWRPRSQHPLFKSSLAPPAKAPHTSPWICVYTSWSLAVGDPHRLGREGGATGERNSVAGRGLHPHDVRF
eukprot:scaffold41924_cov62-Phaeocystis_antarctica.AAC.3